MNPLDKFRKARQELFEYFGYEGIDYGIEFNLNDYWGIIADSDVGWGQENPHEMDTEWPEFTYQEELKYGQFYVGKDYTLVHISEAAYGGGSHFTVFANDKRVDIE